MLVGNQADITCNHEQSMYKIYQFVRLTVNVEVTLTLTSFNKLSWGRVYCRPTSKHITGPLHVFV